MWDVEFACDQVDDGGEIAVGAIAAGFGFGGLDEAVDAFEDSVIDAGSKPAEDSGLVAPDGSGRLDDLRDTAVGSPEIPSVEVIFGLVGGLGKQILEGEADLISAGGFQMTADQVESVELILLFLSKILRVFKPDIAGAGEFRMGLALHAAD